MNKKIFWILFFTISVFIGYFIFERFNPPFFTFFTTKNATIEMELKMASNDGDLEKVTSIINDPKKMNLMSPWGLGMAIGFAAFMVNSKKYKNNQKLKERFNKIILAILDSRYPIDNDYLGQILVYASVENNINMIQAVLKNPYAKYIDKSFKVAIYLQSYMGNSVSMPLSFLKESLRIAQKNNNKEIIAELRTHFNLK